jgi:proline-rich protein PRCC
MMLGIEDYGSDNDSGNESTPSTSKLSLPAASKKSSISLPPPSNSNPSKMSSSGLSLPAPKSKRGPKKITIGLPTLPGDARNSVDDEDDEDEKPAAKKPRLDSGTGAGKSLLISMLPAPKQKAPVVTAPERILGGGKGPGLVFNISRPTTSPALDADLSTEADLAPALTTNGDSEESSSKTSSVSFLPPSLKKGRSNISVEEGKAPPRPAPKVSATPAVDFFSLGPSPCPSFSTTCSNIPTGNTSSSQASSKPTPSPSIPPLPSSSSSTTLQSLSSAPTVDDFTPPEPTPTDPYPGYYLLPSGSWAPHDPIYYKSFYDQWTKDYNAHVRALEKGSVRGFEGYDAYAAASEDGTHEVDMSKEMERAKKEIKEREEKKALTGGAAKEGQLAEPRMNIKGAKLGKMARGRHQLTTLLSEAYQNREALEERIAEGRRNRKEAGNKYGKLRMCLLLSYLLTSGM